uniref:Uncharacterized protein n=1 Tax=Arundo donax TaxID=35708 RepID=A0A0A8XRJ7_ARUDO
MPKPFPPAYVKMPGRPKTQRTREPTEKPKGTKMTKVGIKMKCRLCKHTDHNIRRCHLNKEAGNKNYAYIKRDAARQRAETQSSTSAATNSIPQVSTQQTIRSTQVPAARPVQNRQARKRTGVATSNLNGHVSTQ